MTVLLSLIFFFFELEVLFNSLKVVSSDYLIQTLKPTWRLSMSRSLSATILKHFLKAKRQIRERRYVMYWCGMHKILYVIQEKK